MELLLFAYLLVAKAAASAVGDYHKSHEYLGKASYFNQSTSSFLKIIKTEDVRDRDVIYVNPSVLFIGKEKGQILRCLQAEPTECEVFYEADSNIETLLVTGEYLYAGIYSGLLLRCDLYKKGSCSTFYTCSSGIYGLSSDGGYLYASLYQPPTILKCDLNQPNSCRPLISMEKSYIWAFSHFGKYVYAAQHNGEIVRCSVRASSSCTVVYNLSSPIMALADMSDGFFAVTYNGKLWHCSRKSDASLDCQSVSLNIVALRCAAHFMGELYVANAEFIYVCNWTTINETTCKPYVYHKKTMFLATAYETYQIQSRYKDEHNSCTWQSNAKCPPFVTYYGPHERSALEVHVRNGRLYNSQGYLVDTRNAGHSGAAIFAMGPDGRILLSNVYLGELVHTSSLFAGNPVAGAGEMVVLDGIIMNITTCSEHYRPDLNLNRQVVQSLHKQGYTNQIDSQTCGGLIDHMRQ